MYTREKGRDFWFDFDNRALYQRTPEFNAALRNSYGALNTTFDGVVSAFGLSLSSPDHPAPFERFIAPAAGGFAALAELQLEVIDEHFGGELSSVQSAYEDFGQGVLFDERRRASGRMGGRLIHMMDGSPDDWVGYHRWHAFARAAIVAGADAERWETIALFIGLAWAIQTEADPVIDSDSNPGLPEERLASLRESWLSLSPAQLDQLFVRNASRAPLLPGPSLMLGARFKTNFSLTEVEDPSYAKVQMILDDAAGTGRPMHEGKKRFWNLPLDEFLALSPISGVQLIADEGPNRGARSGLIKALKGEPPFGEDGIPRMPLDRDPVPDDKIAYIESWIDAGCPP